MARAPDADRGPVAGASTETLSSPTEPATNSTAGVRQGGGIRTAYDTVTARLAERTGGTGRGGDWPCPAHDDRNPSLSVTNGDGKVLLHCHAGCNVVDIVTALDLEVADLFDDKTTSQVEAVATYDYTDEDGTLLFQVVRYFPKRRARRTRARRPRRRAGLAHRPRRLAAARSGRAPRRARGLVSARRTGSRLAGCYHPRYERTFVSCGDANYRPLNAPLIQAELQGLSRYGA
jgi:hypothetical protein